MGTMYRSLAPLNVEFLYKHESPSFASGTIVTRMKAHCATDSGGVQKGTCALTVLQVGAKPAFSPHHQGGDGL